MTTLITAAPGGDCAGPRAAAGIYHDAGWQPLALRPRTKQPRAAGWTERTLTKDDLAREFGQDDNIGLKCGTASNGLIDIDIDDPRAYALASRWLPPTTMCHGRGGNPDSHWWYVVDDTDCKTEQFADPEKNEGRGKKMLIELRGDGAQTMVPPSIHPSGEYLVWSGPPTPSPVSLGTLRSAVRKVAAAMLLARSWPSEGGRNNAALALGGALLRAGMAEDLATEFVECVAYTADDEEAEERGASVTCTARKLAAGDAVTGLPNLRTLMGEATVDTAFKWLREAGCVEKVLPWEPPVLFEQMVPPDIPAALLPGALGAYAKALADMAEVPEALPVFAVLGVVATAVARHYMVEPKPGWNEHVNIYAAIALPPGNSKSLVMRRATAPLTNWESIKRDELLPQINEARSRRKSEEKIIERKRAKASKTEDAKERDNLLEEIIQLEMNLTEVPVLPKLFTNDATPEALATSVHEQGGCFAVISDEGGITETLSGLYSNGAANIDILLKGIDGGILRLRRRDREYDLRPILTIVMAFQPQILMNMADKQAFRGNGLLDRFLFLLPQSRLGYRTHNGPPIPNDVTNAYLGRITALLDLAPSAPPGEGDRAGILKLAPKAFDAWSEFQAEVEEQLRPEGRLADIRGWGGKLPGFTLRIAGLVHLSETVGACLEIDYEAMARAVAIARLLIDHALAAKQLMGDDEATMDAKALYEWIVREGQPQFTRTDCLRPHHGRFTGKKRLDAALDVLVQRRIIGAGLQEKTGQAGRPARVYDVNPLVFDRK